MIFVNVYFKIFVIYLLLLNVYLDLVNCDANKNDLEFKYHNYSSMTSFLTSYSEANGDLLHLYNIGQSIGKRYLWVIKITGVGNDTLLIPNIKLIANIHGNEAAGREVLLHFIPYLIDGYKQGDAKITHLLNNFIIHILPSLNPDGFENAIEGKCSGAGRENIRDVDLNRSFPDFFRRNTIPRQPETEAVMRWMNDTQFILSASLHGGAMVANYPFESTKEDLFQEISEHKSPDDDVFRELALVYSTIHPTMHLGKSCPGSEDKRVFLNGITNGAAWYSLTGGMQDYNYAFHGCMELTLEVSCCKYPPAKQLNTIWNENKNALIEFCLQAGMGVKGIIRNAENDEPIHRAFLSIEQRNFTFYTSRNGEYYRILLPGDYHLKIKVQNFTTKIVPFTVYKQGYNKTMTILNVSLKPGNNTEFIESLTSIGHETTTPQNTVLRTTSSDKAETIPNETEDETHTWDYYHGNGCTQNKLCLYNIFFILIISCTYIIDLYF